MDKTLRNNADSYNDPKHNYLRYWDGRDYEHAAEEMAISRLLKDKHFELAVDVGGGYGRLSKYLTKFSDKVILAEPSQQQLDIGAEYLKDTPQVDRRLWQAADLKLKDGEADLVLVVRVLHHLPDPMPEFSEIARVLKPGGTFLMEFANNAHFLNRVRYGLKGKPIPREPVDIRSAEHKKDSEIPFVNHHPATVMRQLERSGFSVDKALSGSNLRNPTIKKVLPRSVLLNLEKVMQPALAGAHFGPSLWLLMHKK
jgi:SAM-dependent methyltransferase